MGFYMKLGIFPHSQTSNIQHPKNILVQCPIIDRQFYFYTDYFCFNIKKRDVETNSR